MGSEWVHRDSALRGMGLGFPWTRIPSRYHEGASAAVLDPGLRGEGWGRASTLKGNFCSTSALGFFDGMIVQPSLGLEVGGSPSSGIRAKASCPLWDLKDGRWGSTRPGRVQDAPCPSPITRNIHGLSLCHDCWDHYMWARHS